MFGDALWVLMRERARKDEWGSIVEKKVGLKQYWPSVKEIT
jgi:hypothetical protein